MNIKKFSTGDVVWITGNKPFSVVQVSDYSYIRLLPFSVQKSLRYDDFTKERTFELKVQTSKEVRELFEIFKRHEFNVFIANSGVNSDRLWINPDLSNIDESRICYKIKDLFIDPLVYALLIVHVPQEDFREFVDIVTNLPGYKTWGTLPGGKNHVLL